MFAMLFVDIKETFKSYPNVITIACFDHNILLIIRGRKFKSFSKLSHNSLDNILLAASSNSLLFSSILTINLNLMQISKQ